MMDVQKVHQHPRKYGKNTEFVKHRRLTERDLVEAIGILLGTFNDI